MIKLAIDNSYSNISGLSIQQHKELSNVLSYELNAQASYFSGYGPKKRTLLSKKGDFPSGLINRAIAYLDTAKVSHSITCLKKRPKANPGLFKLNLRYAPYLEQEEAAEAAINLHQGTIVMPTGSGKSITMCLIIAALRLRTLVIVPNLGLKEQLKVVFDETLPHADITVENIDSPRLAYATDYDCLIIDEAHHSAAKTYRNLNKKAWNNIYYRFFFTASPHRSLEEEQILMESITGGVIYELDYDTAVRKAYIAPIEAFYYELPKVKVKGYTWAEVYTELVVNNKARNDLIHEILVNLHSNKISTLCLVKEIKHGNILSKLSGAAFAHGENEDTALLIKAFNNKKLHTLIGTTGVLGEGIDTKPTEYVIIAGLGKSKVAFMQAIGRGLRTALGKASCKVIIFRDTSHKWTLAHFRAQCKILLDEYGVKVVKLN